MTQLWKWFLCDANKRACRSLSGSADQLVFASSQTGGSLRRKNIEEMKRVHFHFQGCHLWQSSVSSEVGKLLDWDERSSSRWMYKTWASMSNEMEPSHNHNSCDSTVKIIIMIVKILWFYWLQLFSQVEADLKVWRAALYLWLVSPVKSPSKRTTHTKRQREQNKKTPTGVGLSSIQWATTGCCPGVTPYKKSTFSFHPKL